MTGWNYSQWGTKHCALRPSWVAAHALLAAALTAAAGCSDDPFADENTSAGSAAFAATSTDPAANASGVPLNQQVGATFSANPDCATVSTSSFTLSGPNGAVTGTTDCMGNQAIFRPAGALVAGQEYTAALTETIRDQTGNALARFTWRFTTGIAADTTPPAVTSTDPGNGALGVPLNKQISAIFSENLDCASVSAASFTLTGPNGAVPGTPGCTGKQVAYTPSAALATLSLYTAVLKTAIRDSAGNMLAADFAWSFTTGVAPDTTPPFVESTDPANNETNVGIGKTLTASFSESLDCSSVAGNFLLNGPGGAVTGSTGCSGSVATFMAPLAADGAYTARLLADIRDAAGNKLGSDHLWSFRTAPAPDSTPPTVTSRDPVPGASNIPLNQVVRATFSETLNCATVNPSSFHLNGPTGTVGATVTCATNTPQLTPAANLQPTTTYMATLTTGIQDPTGNALASDIVWSFTTLTPSDTTPPTVFSTDPVNNETGVSTSIILTATFSETVTCGADLAVAFQLRESASGATVSGKVTCSGNQVSFDPDGNLKGGLISTSYTATLNATITDLAGNPFAPFSWTFTTAGLL